MWFLIIVTLFHGPLGGVMDTSIANYTPLSWKACVSQAIMLEQTLKVDNIFYYCSRQEDYENYYSRVLRGESIMLSETWEKRGSRN